MIAPKIFVHCIWNDAMWYVNLNVRVVMVIPILVKYRLRPLAKICWT